MLPILALLLAAPDPAPGIVASEFVFETAPHPSCHASTIADVDGALIAAWFGGTAEGKPDVCIWTSRRENGAWTPPQQVADGVQPDGKRHPCWNPVLFRHSAGTLTLFYKVGPSPEKWWGERKFSSDGGRTWGAAERLPDGILGPIKNKPVELPRSGIVVAPSSSEGHADAPAWRVHFERSTDAGRTWDRTAPRAPADSPAAIQPSVLIQPDGTLQAVGRTRSSGKLFWTQSIDGGKTWERLSLLDLPNPNSGTDAVTLKDGTHLLVYNHTPVGRSPLNVAVSKDGRAWSAALVLERERGEYSYPAVIQSADGMVHVTYTWKRQRVKHVTVDPAKLTARPIVGGKWPD